MKMTDYIRETTFREECLLNVQFFIFLLTVRVITAVTQDISLTLRKSPKRKHAGNWIRDNPPSPPSPPFPAHHSSLHGICPRHGPPPGSALLRTNIRCLSRLLHDCFSMNMSVDQRTVGATWETCFEGLCMCMCVFCACATIPSEIQSCDVPLIYTVPPNTPTEDLYSFLCSFYRICSVWHERNCFDLFYYVKLQWTKKKMHFLFYSLLRAVTYSFC